MTRSTWALIEVAAMGDGLPAMPAEPGRSAAPASAEPWSFAVWEEANPGARPTLDARMSSAKASDRLTPMAGMPIDWMLAAEAPNVGRVCAESQRGT
jgi:hypothetical protein